MWMILIILAILFMIHQFYWRRKHYPPGPMPFPLVGNILSFLWHPPGFRAMQKWKEKFGGVYTMWVATIPVVTVNDWKTVQETFINDADSYVDRKTVGDLTAFFRGGYYGLTDTSGYLWKEQRRFTLHTLRDFGLGKAEMQKRIDRTTKYSTLIEVVNEAVCMLDLLEEESRKGPLEVSQHLDRTVGSVINLVLFGYRYDEANKEEFFKMRDVLDSLIRCLSNPAYLVLLNCMWLRHLPIFSGMYTFLEEVRDNVNQSFTEKIIHHEERVDYETEDSSDFCESYLKELKKRYKEEDSTFSKKQLLNICEDLWMAGLETTSVTLSWAILYLIRHPPVQDKAHEELDRVIKCDRVIDMHDKQNLPYINAVINETQRCANIVPLNLLRTVNKNVVMGGFKIPAGTVVAPQICMLLYDPEVFPDPEAFDPMRFIDSDGYPKKVDQFTPFSVGRRKCVGESLASMELFIFIANLLHKFELKADITSQMPSMQKKMFSIKPSPYKCILNKRVL